MTYDADNDTDECERCEGTGDRYGRMARYSGGAPCPDCQGTGHVLPPNACPMCGSVAGYADGPPCLTCHYNIPPGSGGAA